MESSTFRMDLRFNLFKTIDYIYSSFSESIQDSTSNLVKFSNETVSKLKDTNQIKSKNLLDICKYEPNKSNILMYGNPLVCDCEHNWWSNIDSSLTPTLFYVNNTYCLHIEDFESLSCSSQPYSFSGFNLF
jgi:hypothetical protein